MREQLKEYYLEFAGNAGTQNQEVVVPKGFRMRVKYARFDHNGTGVTYYFIICDKDDNTLAWLNYGSGNSGQGLHWPHSITATAYGVAEDRTGACDCILEAESYFKLTTGSLAADKTGKFTLVYTLEPKGSLYVPPS